MEVHEKSIKKLYKVKKRTPKQVLFVIILLFIGLYTLKEVSSIFLTPILVSIDSGKVYRSPKTAPIIFVGGHESTGTGLMRVLLDVHPLIRCGGEPIINQYILDQRDYLLEKLTEINKRRIEAIQPDVLDAGLASFILEIIVKMGPRADFLCHKHPPIYNYMLLLADMFPKAKFIHMLRDGRAAVASSIRRGLNVRYNTANEFGALMTWEKTTERLLKKCRTIGPDRCLTVRYEDLILESESELRLVFDFLKIQWDPIVLHHEKFLNNITHPTRFEPSTKQFMKNIHPDSLGLWATDKSVFSKVFINSAHNKSVLLQKLGYAQVGLPPDYRRLPKPIPVV